MGSFLSTSVSGLLAFQRAIDATSQNIANVSTPGYSRQRAEMVTRPAQMAGNGWIGSGVDVATTTRAYDSPAESFRDYVDVLRNNPRYADALNTGSDAKAFASALQKSGYATDPRYAMKIETIAQNLPFSETALKSSPDAPMTSPTDVF